MIMNTRSAAPAIGSTSATLPNTGFTASNIDGRVQTVIIISVF
jgi:hypothetical protein